MARKKTIVKSTAIDTIKEATSVASNIDTTVVSTNNVTDVLMDSDEIEVISMIPNVSYGDNRTGDFYRWDEVGHIEIMTWEAIKNLWRGYKGYFKDLWLKPLDNRVIKKLGLGNNYQKYEFLMDGKNYTRANIASICDEIAKVHIGLKYSIFNNIKNLVASGELSDINVVMTLEKRFNLDLISILGR